MLSFTSLVHTQIVEKFQSKELQVYYCQVALNDSFRSYFPHGFSSSISFPYLWLLPSTYQKYSGEKINLYLTYMNFSPVISPQIIQYSKYLYGK